MFEDTDRRGLMMLAAFFLAMAGVIGGCLYWTIANKSHIADLCESRGFEIVSTYSGTAFCVDPATGLVYSPRVLERKN